MTNTATVKVRSTIPGRASGLKDWTREELEPIIASYKQRYLLKEWTQYLTFESKNGFITNKMNDHIKFFLAESVPGLHAKHYSVGAVDFRFANNATLHFSMWLPKNREQRARRYTAYLKELRNNHQSPLENGSAQWTSEQIIRFMKHLQDETPTLWAKYRELCDVLGFIDLRTSFDISNEVSKVFSVPEDIDYGRSMGIGLFDEANRLYNFELAKPENKKKQDELLRGWMEAEERDSMSFDDWYRTLK